jgi:hypothetical protein
VKNYVKITKAYVRQGFDVKLDFCSIALGGKHPVIQAFLPAEFSEKFAEVLHACPYGVRLIFIVIKFQH